MQLTVFSFQSQYPTQYYLLFMNILLITIPPLIMFSFFNRQIRGRDDGWGGQGLAGPRSAALVST